MVAVEDSNPVLRIDQLKKSFNGHRVLKGVDLSVHGGECILLTGSNGAGKSVFSRCVAGLGGPYEGEITVKNIVLSGSRASARDAGVAYIPQQRIAPQAVSVSEFLALGSAYSICGTARSSAWGLAQQRSDELGLPLDGIGPKKMLSDLGPFPLLVLYLLKAMLRTMNVLILDEPTAGIPRKNSNDVFLAVERIRQRGNNDCVLPAVLMIAHPEQLPEDIAERKYRFLSMEEGVLENKAVEPRNRIEVTGTVEERTRVSQPRWKAELDPRVAKQLNRAEPICPGRIYVIVGDESAEFSKLCRDFASPAAVLRVYRKTADRGMSAVYSYLPFNARRSRLLHRRPGKENALVFRWEDTRLRLGPFISKSRIQRLVDRVVRLGNVTGLPAPEAELGVLSGGNQQRFLIGRVLSGDPDLMACVDLFAGLDENGVEHVRVELGRHVSRGNAVILLTTNASGAEVELADIVFELASNEG